ncbi:hypothetical protein QLX08_007242 [Tetragonisca angustula]
MSGVLHKIKRKNAGTQTDTKIDTVVEIARLEEEIKLLTIENKHLRRCLGDQKFMKTSLPHPNDIEKCNETVLNSSQAQSVQKKDINIMPHCSCKTKCSTKRCRCLKRNIPCGQSCKCNTNICLNQNNDNDNDFNPMQPTHEIPRSPLCDNNKVISCNISEKSSITSDNSSIMSVTSTKEEIPSEFDHFQVNWEEHQAQLVACKKCNRKFHPLRIKKHESCCKKL